MVDTEKNSRALKIIILFILFSVGDIFCVEAVRVQTGENYTFKSSASGTPQTILWKFNKNKVVEHESDDYSWYKFEGRADLNIQTGDFTLTQLRKEDSGHYESEIQVDGKLQYSYHDIKVIDPVTKLTVTCERPGEGGAIILRCLPSPQVQANFEWKGPDDFTHSGQTVNISQEPGPDMVYYCTAKNEVSEESTHFNLQDCLKGGGLSGGNIFLIILGVIGPIGVGGLAFWGYKRFQGEKQPRASFQQVELAS